LILHARTPRLPYTTLCRSEVSSRADTEPGDTDGSRDRAHSPGTPVPLNRRLRGRAAFSLGTAPALLRARASRLTGRGLRPRRGPDRKSTRLNSSHVSISYA